MLNSMYFRNTEPTSADMGMAVRLVTPTTPVPVAIISGGTASGTTSAVTYPALTGAAQTLLAALTRISFTVVNDSANTLYVKKGAAASASSYTYKLNPGQTVDVSDWSGIVTAFSSAATGNAAVTEVTT